MACKTKHDSDGMAKHYSLTLANIAIAWHDKHGNSLVWLNINIMAQFSMTLV